MLTCRDVSRLVSDAMDRELPLTARIRVRMHLLLCPPCKRYEDQVHLLRQTARHLYRHVTEGVEGSVALSDEARGRILQTLQDAQA